MHTRLQLCINGSRCQQRFWPLLLDSDTDTSPGFFCCTVTSRRDDWSRSSERCRAVWHGAAFGLPLHKHRRAGSAAVTGTGRSPQHLTAKRQKKNPKGQDLPKRKGDSSTVWKIKSRICTINWSREGWGWGGSLWQDMVAGSLSKAVLTA